MMSKTKEELDFVCEGCGRLIDISEIGYLGPRNRSDTSCHPLMDFQCLCTECEKSEEKNDESRTTQR